MFEFLTLKEVMTILRIGERTAYELCRTGQMGGAVKVGGQWRVEKQKFKAWVCKGGGATGEEAEPPRVV